MISLDPNFLEQLGRLPAAPLGNADRQVVARGVHLPPRDRLIVELVYVHHVPMRRVAALLGIAPGNVSRQARQLWRRLSDPMVAKLCGEPCPFDPQTRSIGLDFFLRKVSPRDIARAHGLTVRQVSEVLGFVRGFQHAARRANQCA